MITRIILLLQLIGFFQSLIGTLLFWHKRNCFPINGRNPRIALCCVVPIICLYFCSLLRTLFSVPCFVRLWSMSVFAQLTNFTILVETLGLVATCKLLGEIHELQQTPIRPFGWAVNKRTYFRPEYLQLYIFLFGIFLVTLNAVSHYLYPEQFARPEPCTGTNFITKGLAPLQFIIAIAYLYIAIFRLNVEADDAFSLKRDLVACAGVVFLSLLAWLMTHQVMVDDDLIAWHVDSLIEITSFILFCFFYTVRPLMRAYAHNKVMEKHQTRATPPPLEVPSDFDSKTLLSTTHITGQPRNYREEMERYLAFEDNLDYFHKYMEKEFIPRLLYQLYLELIPTQEDTVNKAKLTSLFHRYKPCFDRYVTLVAAWQKILKSVHESELSPAQVADGFQSLRALLYQIIHPCYLRFLETHQRDKHNKQQSEAASMLVEGFGRIAAGQDEKVVPVPPPVGDDPEVDGRMER